MKAITKPFDVSILSVIYKYLWGFKVSQFDMITQFCPMSMTISGTLHSISSSIYRLDKFFIFQSHQKIYFRQTIFKCKLSLFFHAYYVLSWLRNLLFHFNFKCNSSLMQIVFLICRNCCNRLKYVIELENRHVNQHLLLH